MALTAVTVNVTAGKDCYCYGNSGNYSSPSWAEMGNIQEVKIDNGTTLYELKLRGRRPYPSNVPTIQPISVSFKIPDLPGDTLLAALIIAKNAGSAIDLVFLDGVINAAVNTITNQGPRADWVVEKLDRTEGTDEAAMYDVVLKPGQTANAMTWASYTGS